MSFLKSIWKGNSKHKKLPGDLKKSKDIEEPEAEVPTAETSEKDDKMTFKLKYLGSTGVDKATGDNISPEAVKNVIKVAKAAGKKVQRVNVAISLKGITVTDTKGNDMFEVSIYRISNCSTDKQFRQIFSFISIDAIGTLECHVFWCSKRKMAEMVALTVAHAFSTAYETWKTAPGVAGTNGAPGTVESENIRNTLNTMKNNLAMAENNDLMDVNGGEEIIEEKLIDFDDPVTDGVTLDISSYAIRPSHDLLSAFNQTQWVCFDDDFGGAFRDDAHKNQLQDVFECNFASAFGGSDLCQSEFSKSNFALQNNSQLCWNTPKPVNMF